MKLRVAVVVVGAWLLVRQPDVPAGDHPPVDPDLLEFLGSVDSEDKDWHDYLAHTDIDQVARRAGQSRRGLPSQPPAPAPASPKLPAADGAAPPAAPVSPP